MARAGPLRPANMLLSKQGAPGCGLQKKSSGRAATSVPPRNPPCFDRFAALRALEPEGSQSLTTRALGSRAVTLLRLHAREEPASSGGCPHKHSGTRGRFRYDEAAVNGLFPDRELWTGGAPGVHYLKVGSRLACHPLDEI